MTRQLKRNLTELRRIPACMSHPWGRLARAVSAFAADRRGVVAIFFVLALVPIVAAGGAGVDLSRAYTVKQRLGNALDAAGLAVGSASGLSDSELNTLAQKYFDANYPAKELGVPATPVLTINDSEITLTATADVDTTLLRLAQIDSLLVAATTTIKREETKGLEVVLVLDNTGRMHPRMASLKEASETFVEILFGDEAEPDFLKVGIVPFTGAVNVGTDENFRRKYIEGEDGEGEGSDTTGGQGQEGSDTTGGQGQEGSDTTGGHQPTANSTTGGNPTAGGQQPSANPTTGGQGGGGGEGSVQEEQTAGRSDQDYLPDHWRGCVEAREHPFDTTDDSQLEPDLGGGKWRRFLSPFHNQANNWVRLRPIGGPFSNHMFVGPNKLCPVELLPLTNVKEDVLDKIDEMLAYGFPHINLGAVWGWRVLSPSEPYTNGAAYSDEKTNKAIVIMTHFHNIISAFSTIYTAYDTPANDRLGNIPNRSLGRGNRELDRRLTDVCTKMKNLDILVFTIVFDSRNGSLKRLMSDCATDSGKHFEPSSGADLQQAFESIAAQLRNHGSGAGSNLRIGN